MLFKKKLYNYLMLAIILILILLPFILNELLRFLNNYFSIGYSSIDIIPEYYKLIGTLIIIIIGIFFAEKLLEKRLKTNKDAELNNFKRYFNILELNLKKMKSNNYINSPENPKELYIHFTNIIDNILKYPKQSINIEMSLTNEGEKLLNDIRIKKVEILVENTAYPFNENVIDELLKIVSNFHKEIIKL